MSETQEIKFIVTANTASAEAAMARVGKQTELMGKKSESARLAAFGMGESLENVAQRMGIPNAAARKLGTSVESLTMSMGKGALAFGAVGLAGMALYGVYQQITEAQAKWRAGIEQSGSAAEEWIAGLYKEEKQTKELAAAIREQTEAKKEQARFDLQQKKNLDEDAIIGKQRDLNRLQEEYNGLRWGKGDDASTGLALQMEQAKRDEMDQLQRDIRQKQADIKVANERLKQAQGATPSGKDSEEEEEKRRLQAIFDNKVYAANREWEFDQRIAEGKRAFDKAQLEDFEQVERAKLQIKQQYDQALLATVGSALNAYAALSHKNAKLVFYAQKALAMAQVVADTGRAAMSAAATAAVLGPEAAAAASASMWTLGKINMAIIAATALAGPGGGGGGGGGAPPALPTYNANPATGLPSSSDAGKTLNLTLVINGERRQAIEITQDIVQTLYDQNGAVGGLKVAVERSA